MILKKIMILLVFIILLFSSWACGKKAPPRMPVTESDKGVIELCFVSK